MLWSKSVTTESMPESLRKIILETFRIIFNEKFVRQVLELFYRQSRNQRLGLLLLGNFSGIILGKTEIEIFERSKRPRPRETRPEPGSPYGDQDAARPGCHRDVTSPDRHIATETL